MRFYLLVLVLLSGCTTLSPERPGTGAVFGRVTDEAGESVAGAAVVVLDVGDGSIGAATDINGLFAVGSVPRGSHEIEVRFTGMYPERFDVLVGEGPTVQSVVLRRDTSTVDVSVCGPAC